MLNRIRFLRQVVALQLAENIGLWKAYAILEGDLLVRDFPNLSCAFLLRDLGPRGIERERKRVHGWEPNVECGNRQQNNPNNKTTVKKYPLPDSRNTKWSRKNAFDWSPASTVFNVGGDRRLGLCRLANDHQLLPHITLSPSSNRDSDTLHPLKHRERRQSHQDSPEYSSLRPTIDPWWPSTHLIARRARSSSHAHASCHPTARRRWKSTAALAACCPLLMHPLWCRVMVGGVDGDGWFRTPSLDEWPSSVGFLHFAIFNWELAKFWLLPKWSQHGPLTSSWPPERASTPLLSVENDFPSGLANDGLRNTLHHDYVRRDTSLQKVLRDTLPVELVCTNAS
jgi:hypothetical protein